MLASTSRLWSNTTCVNWLVCWWQIGTLLMDWVEVVCYYHIRPFTHENGAGFRACPFMLNDCF